MNQNIKKNAQKLIDTINEGSKESDRIDGGILVNTIEKEIDQFDGSLTRLIEGGKDNPETLNTIEQVLIAICGWGFDSLADRVRENFDYYASL